MGTKVVKMLAMTAMGAIPVVPVGIAQTDSMSTPAHSSTRVRSTTIAPVVRCPSNGVSGHAIARALQPSHVAMEVVCLALTLASFTKIVKMLAMTAMGAIPVVPVGIA